MHVLCTNSPRRLGPSRRMTFSDIVEQVCTTAPLQKKRLSAYLASRDESYFQNAERFATEYSDYLTSEGLSVDQAVAAYVQLCSDMMRLQVAFMKSGEYPTHDMAEAYEQVYSNDSEMKAYLIGLALSQFLWPTHYEMFCFFKRHLADKGAEMGSYLEIGPGHGLYLNTALKILPPHTSLTALDISETAIRMAQAIVRRCRPDAENRLCYVNQDVLKYDPGEYFDFIVMGEVLEHVNFPEHLVAQVCTLLSEKGWAFVSTCLNAPAIDHVFQFKNVDHIRSLFTDAHLIIEDERVLPVEDCSADEATAKRITVNYCALLRKE